MQVRKQQLELDMEQQTGFKQEKEFVKESEKVGLKVNIQKTKIMASGLIISRQIDGEIMETVRDFTFGGSKIIADGDCSHEIKTFFLEEKL